MGLDRFFMIVSYLLVACGVLSLWLTGGVGAVTALGFGLLAMVAFRLESGRWQLSERLGTVIVVCVVPVAVLAWRFGLIGSGGAALAALLGQLIIVLSLVKLFQRKTDRDWVFLYLMAFFEVLLAAGVTISPLYLFSLILFLLIGVCAILVFEIKRTSGASSTLTMRSGPIARRLPVSALVISVLIVIIATPFFFLLPRVGGAGFLMSRNGITARTGFSDSVRLGEIGRIQQDDAVVMRVRVDGADRSTTGLRWRGVALDQFDNKGWKSTKPFTDPPYVRLESGYFLVNFASGKTPLLNQTFYVEPLDTPVLFALSKPVAVAGGFDLLFKNSDDNLKFQRRGFERISYKVGSDPYLPPDEVLRTDAGYDPASMARFLQLPDDIDPRIASLSDEVIKGAVAQNRLDRSRAIEKYLRDSFAYTLELRSGGEQPVADFLFNVKAGHCEYFASAMALMLRTQGIPSRVVNGFQQGEFNATADVFVVRQRDAHSWVEVYFPEEGMWVPFDPTPSIAAARDGQGGVLGAIDRYVEALEMLWIQYFVAYDNEEQESLLKSVRTGASDFQSRASDYLTGRLDSLKRLWNSLLQGFGLGRWTSNQSLSGDTAFLAALLGVALVVSMIVVAYRLGALNRLLGLLGRRRRGTVVEFYERMLSALAKRGLVRKESETPLEFAVRTGFPEALSITDEYNRVRFGRMGLCDEERARIEAWLARLESGNPATGEVR